MHDNRFQHCLTVLILAPANEYILIHPCYNVTVLYQKEQKYTVWKCITIVYILCIESRILQLDKSFVNATEQNK